MCANSFIGNIKWYNPTHFWMYMYHETWYFVVVKVKKYFTTNLPISTLFPLFSHIALPPKKEQKGQIKSIFFINNTISVNPGILFITISDVITLETFLPIKNYNKVPSRRDAIGIGTTLFVYEI